MVAHDFGYYFARLHEILKPLDWWLWFRIIPDSMMLLGGILLFVDLTWKLWTAYKAKPSEIEAK